MLTIKLKTVHKYSLTFFQNVVASPVRPAPGYTGSPTSSISGSAGSGGAISKSSYSNRENPTQIVENQHIKDTAAGRRSNGSQSESPISSSGSTTSSSAVRKISSSESEANKIIQILSSPIAGNRATSMQSPSTLQMPPARHPAQIVDHFQQVYPQDKVINESSASASLNQRNFFPSTPVGMSQQQFSEMEYLTSRYLRQQQQQIPPQQQQLQHVLPLQQQQQQQIQLMFEQQQQMQQEPRKSVYRSGCFDSQLNVLRKEMVKP